MLTSSSSMSFDRVLGRGTSDGVRARKSMTTLAPSRSVYPQSPSPTIVSYFVIRGSEAMREWQPEVMMLRIWESVNWREEVIGVDRLVADGVSVVREEVGRACGLRREG